MGFQVRERNRLGPVYPAFVEVVLLLLSQTPLVFNDFFELLQELQLFDLLVGTIIRFAQQAGNL